MGRNSKNSKKKSGKERKELLAKELLRKKDCAKRFVHVICFRFVQ